jgi:hypothetical protein
MAADRFDVGQPIMAADPLSSGSSRLKSRLRAGLPASQGETLSLAEARRIALAAQGFDRPRPGDTVCIRRVRRTIRQLGLIQIDCVNVLVPAHYQVLFSRLGPYDRRLLDELLYKRREFTEQWAHEASIIPMATWPLLRQRMETHRVRPWPFAKTMERHPEYVAWVLEEVRARGPLGAETLDHPPELSASLQWSWSKSVPRAVLEAHFGRGLLAIADRRGNFARLYDLAERVIPAEHLTRRMEPAEARRELIRIAARAHGIGTAADLADYFRMPVRDARQPIADLAEAGELREIRVEGWREPAWLHRDAKPLRRDDAAALLSPFDPVVWFRPRLLRLFGFDHRFEIFVPADKRRWGCYVLPFLMGDRLVARVDLRNDREGRRLLVLGAWKEADVDTRAVAQALAAELRTLASWLELESVKVERRGDLARTLAATFRSS